MPHINANRRNRAGAATPAGAAALVLLLACLGLAACGGSSSSTSTSANAAAAAPSSTTRGTGTGPTGARAGRFQALRECLQKNGITLPKRTPGQRPGGGAGGFLGGGTRGPQLPAGVTRAQYEAAAKKCGGGAFVGGGSRIRSPVAKQAFAKFAKCMRENGVNLPEPNTSGSAPIFSTKGLDTASASFKTAESKCLVVLRGSFGRGPKGGGPPTAQGGTTEAPGGTTVY